MAGSQSKMCVCMHVCGRQTRPDFLFFYLVESNRGVEAGGRMNGEKGREEGKDRITTSE